MSSTRVPLLATILVFTSMVTACADPMAPAARPRAQGMTVAADVQTAAPATKGTNTGTTTSGTGTKPKPTSTTAPKEPDGAKSGYNVTAY